MFTPRDFISAAEYVGDIETRACCPYGLSSATREELRRLVLVATLAGWRTTREG